MLTGNIFSWELCHVHCLVVRNSIMLSDVMFSWQHCHCRFKWDVYCLVMLIALL